MSRTVWIVLATLLVVAIVNFAAWGILRSQGRQLAIVPASTSSST